MRNTIIVSLTLSLILTIASCGQSDPNKEIDEGSVKGEIYESKEIGWTMEIPKGWKIISKDKIEDDDQKSKDAMEKVYGQELDIKSLKHLISFQKDPFNLFLSTSEPFVEKFPGEYEVNNKKVYELIYKTLVDKGIKVDTSSGKEIIQGLYFNTFYMTIPAPKGEIIMNQVVYNKLINGFSFGVTICYNNFPDKKTLLRTWKNSRFDQ